MQKQQGLGAAAPLDGGTFGAGQSLGSEQNLDSFLNEHALQSKTPLVDWRMVPYGPAPYDIKHHKNVAATAVNFARGFNLGECQIAELFLAAMLHDIGNDGIFNPHHYQSSAQMAEKILRQDAAFWEREKEISLDRICYLIKNHNSPQCFGADQQAICLYDADKYDSFRHEPNTSFGIQKVRAAFAMKPLNPLARDARLIKKYAETTYKWNRQLLDNLFPSD